MIKFFNDEVRAFVEFISEPKIPPVELYVVPYYDTIQTSDGEFAFAAYNPKENRIIAAEGVSEEVKDGILHCLAHEYYHHIQKVNGVDFDEDEAENFAQKMCEEWYGDKNA